MPWNFPHLFPFYPQFNEEKEKEYEEAKKKKMLDALEEKWKVRTRKPLGHFKGLIVVDWFLECWFWFLQISKEEKETYGSSWFSYGTSIATNILENLQVMMNFKSFKDMFVRTALLSSIKEIYYLDPLHLLMIKADIRKLRSEYYACTEFHSVYVLSLLIMPCQLWWC